ncbi:hypothetical protein CW745_13215 [Psychromonas sp. psych-6C06]|uniref:conjugal transfer protein TraF n=1 Tax=Psychromonas sp. psych-6C06 TaxID=2058089 RepID=UPI000C31C230|nr:conjugal transfer protein TraF [Psychromonas sp. psych-6C06]PKF60828.1 hypothetical protein CW745_13215 [Psychromonas sp. psych-6C06]
MDILTINKLAPKKLLSTTLFSSAVMFSSLVMAGGEYYTTGPQSTYGSVTYNQGNYINVINPASAAFHRQHMDPDDLIIGSASLGAGLEYGGVDDLFKRIDELSENFKPSDDSNDGGGDAGAESEPGFELGDIIDLENPELQALIKKAKKKAAVVGGALVFVTTEGYAQTYVDSNINFLINKEIAGGTLAFNLQSSLSTGFVGIADNIDFDEQQALAELKALYESDLQPGDQIAEYDLSGGLSLTVDPNTGKVRANFQNDSVLISKAAKIVEFGMTYSRSIEKNDSGELFLGVKPKMNWIGLTQVAVRMGDLTDSKALFQDVDDLAFNYDSKFGLDLGVYWNADNYALGSTLVNTTEPTFDYPELNTSRYQNSAIARQIQQESHYKLDRQLKVEASLFTHDYRWFTGLSADINETQDPLHQRFQWLAWSAGYQPPLWWFSNVRTGAKHNLAGSELTYLNLGATFLKFINLDISSTLLVTSINDIDLPRGVRADLGLNFAF